MRHVLLVVLWGSAVGAVALMALAVYEARRGPTPQPQPVSIDRAPAHQPRNALARWTLTERFSAHNIVVAHVETNYLHEALGIAQQIIEPGKDRYAEVLIYFHRPGRPDTLPPRRVQWTPTTGYVETVYE